jgi:hypothetical protein
MTPAALLAFMLALVGGRAPDGLVEYRDAIIATDASPEELRVLAVVAKHETYYHLTSNTPPFGLTDREQRGLPRLTIPASARVALAVLRYTRARCAAAGAPSWAEALGHYHHGSRGVPHGCWADRLSTREAREAGVR